MNRVLRPHDSDSFEFDPTKHPGLSLLAAYLFNLRNTCGYYGINDKTTWRLNDKQRDSALNAINNPFERLAEKLSCFTQQLRLILADKNMDGQERAQNLCEWAESMIEHWGFFKRELGAARGLAAAASAASESRHPNLAMTMPDTSANSCNCKMESCHELEKAQIWDSIRDKLAAEGVGDDAVVKIADDLKAFVRDLVRGQRPEIAPNEAESSCHAVNTSDITASEELGEVRHFSKDLLDPKAISSKVTAALDRITTDFHQVANEVLAVVLQDGEDTKIFRQVLDVIYFTACRDTTRAKVLAKLAKHVQDRATPHIRELMMSKKWAKVKAEGGDSTNAPGPVTSWYLGKCKRTWATGKIGSSKLSAEDFAFGLPRFIGELAKSGVFQGYHVHIYIRDKWKPMMERDEFVAVYQLLKITGRMCEGKKMRACFENIESLIKKEDTPSCIKALAEELHNLRESGWKSKESEVIDQVEEEMRKKT
ncbi:hypothetical protein INS49_010018 [Diaporthe citri]|uniref:uncharacterized protein n=1 Tax=Diaporthe citri TaxID=83186 RepID=UPI001C7EEFEB|nr:uncharacterized protein INS49_010018 [Diaporthe citri]KAG6361789.1 hypothetical protein INS49_010018 [Diaporthe citri]